MTLAISDGEAEGDAGDDRTAFFAFMIGLSDTACIDNHTRIHFNKYDDTEKKGYSQQL